MNTQIAISIVVIVASVLIALAILSSTPGLFGNFVSSFVEVWLKYLVAGLFILVVGWLWNRRKKISRERLPLLVALIAGVVILGGAGYFGITQYQNYQQENTETERQIKELTKAQQEKDRQLEEEKRQQSSDIAALKRELEILREREPEVIKQTIVKEIPLQTTDENDPETPVQTVEENDLPSVVQQWRPRIARIECDRTSVNQFGDVVRQDITVGSGTGLYVHSSDKYIIWTNRHVARWSGGKLCRISFPDSTSPPLISIGARINPNSDQDKATVEIPKPDERLRNILAETPNLCARSKTISVGDKIVILGYPGIGSQTDITATEGIISGYDGDYFITSAKIEQGNSGGAAILVKDNCYLGIPTFAQVGVIESLARILDWRKF